MRLHEDVARPVLISWQQPTGSLIQCNQKTHIMKITKTMLAILATGLLSCGLFSSEANAVAITGTIGFTSQSGGTVSQSGSMTTINFNNPARVDFGTGSYASVPPNTAVNFTSFSFNGSGGSATLVGGPIVPEWIFSVGGITYSFDLTSLIAGTYSSGNPSTLTVQGMGVAHATGFSDTSASFSLQGTGNGFTFQIIQESTTGSGNAVPDGGSAVALLGIALVGVEALRRKLATA